MGKGLAVFALVIALAGLGLGGYAVFTIITAPETTSIKGTWYDTQSPHSCSGSWEDIDDLVVDFTVNPGENIYIIYNSYIELDGFDAYFKIYIDGIEVGYQMWVTSDNAVIVSRFSITLQHFIPAGEVNTIGYGAHNVTIWVISFSSSIISSNSLFVQTFI